MPDFETRRRNTWILGDTLLAIRPIQPADAGNWIGLLDSLSWATRYMRGARRAGDLSPEDVERAVNPVAPGELALVAMARTGDREHMAGVVRGLDREGNWLFTLVVTDAWQRRGVGRRLMLAMIAEIHARGGREVEGEVLGSNRNMLDFVRRLGFRIEAGKDALVRRVVLDLPIPAMAGTGRD